MNDVQRIYEVVMIFVKNSLQNLGDVAIGSKMEKVVQLLTKLAN